MKYKRWNRVFEGVVPDVYYFNVQYNTNAQLDFSTELIELLKSILSKYSSDVTVTSIVSGPNLNNITITLTMTESEFDLFSDLGIITPIEIVLSISSSLNTSNLLAAVRRNTPNSIKSIQHSEPRKTNTSMNIEVFKVDPSIYSGDPVKSIVDNIDLSKMSLVIVDIPWSNTGYKAEEFSTEKVIDAVSAHGDKRDKLINELKIDISNLINLNLDIVKEYFRSSLSKLNITATPKNLKDYTRTIESQFFEIEKSLDSAKDTKTQEPVIISLLELEIELGKNMRSGYIEQPVASDYIMKTYELLSKYDISNERAEELLPQTKYHKEAKPRDY